MLAEARPSEIILPRARDLPYVIRSAEPSDALSLVKLYNDAYSPAGSRNASATYPFVQFLDENWVSGAIADGTYKWVVAVLDERIVGAFGMLANVGTSQDRISEAFGLVVENEHRSSGVGAKLFRALTARTSIRSDFILSETRTAFSHPSSIVSRSGYIPLGFEPYAHRMPTGFEGMVMFGKMSDTGISRRCSGGTCSKEVGALSQPILEFLGLKPLRVQLDFLRERSDLTRSLSLILKDTPMVEIEYPLDHSVTSTVSMNRLIGKDPAGSRYLSRTFHWVSYGHPIGQLDLTYDKFDQRARVHRLRIKDEKLEFPFVASVLESLPRLIGETHHSVVIEVRADRASFQRQLQDIGFIPTVYYPCFITSSKKRVDCVQFTRLSGFRLSGSTAAVNVDCPKSIKIIQKVAQSSKEPCK